MTSTPSAPNSVTRVIVRRQWNDWQKASYAVGHLRDIRWMSISGGVRTLAPQPFLHALVQCDAMLEGEVAHSGVHGPCPHTIRVCIVKKDNDPAVFSLL